MIGVIVVYEYKININININIRQQISILIQIHIQNMNKTVDNYQISDANSYLEDGIQTYLAQHIVSKLPYLLKKINIKDTSDRTKYQSLLNQIGILKMLSSPSVVECHKMLKTTNNIYLVYDYCNGVKLSELLSNKTAIKDLKILIILQLIEVLVIMAAASIVHCNLKPSAIIVGNDKKIKVMNFTYGHNRDNKKTIPVKFKPIQSQYVAPEIHLKGIVHQKSDLYSLGVILTQMNFSSQDHHLGVQNHNKIIKLIQKLMSENPNQRPDLQQIESVFKNKERKKSIDEGDKNLLHSPTPSLKKTNSDNSEKEKRILSPIASNPQVVKQNQKKFVQLILKRRNLAIFLLEMSQTCLKVQEEEKRLGLFLSYMLMKKSCKVINGLLGFLKNQKNFQRQIDRIVLQKNERASFERKSDFFKLVSTIQKQAVNQKKWLQDIYKNISPELPTKFRHLSNLEQFDDHNLVIYITQFLTDILDSSTILEQLTNKISQNLYLMSQIIPHESYEKMFEQMISEQKVSLDQQHLYIHVRKMDKKQLVSQIAARIKAK